MRNIMDWPTHTSMVVAPLKISKAMSSKTSSLSEGPQTATSTADGAWGNQQSGQLTPPPTPHEPEATFERYHDFHTYLRAYYPYHPTCDDQSSTVTLPLNGGDVILVHSVHTNGWADGTLLTSGARGWLPTNYCEGYDSEPMRPLMKALTVFWDLVKGSDIGGLIIFRNSDYVKGLVGGVRLMLVRIPFQIQFSVQKLLETYHIGRSIPTALTENPISFSPTLRCANIAKRFCRIFPRSSRLPKAWNALSITRLETWMLSLTWMRW